MTSPIPLGGGRFTVPGNRWDLLSDMGSRPVSVAVVVPYYNQQDELDLVLAALDSQDYPADLTQIIVADDGSARPPAVTTQRVSVHVVEQADLGFRAAAARNLGAAAAEAEVLCFLDADTIPQPDYLRRIVALPSRCPDALVVGRRRHADFTGWTPDTVRRWCRGDGEPNELDEPQWLAEEYARSGDLLHIDESSYRYVISSVMCCTAMLFDVLGGFDESFQQYGGEDWEFGHRAMVGGAVLHHARQAVAWHVGPDWAGRSVTDRARSKNVESIAVARLVPHAEARVRGLVYEYPEIAVAVDVDSHGPGSLLATIGCFADLDFGVWLQGPNAQALLDELRLSDPRIRTGAIPEPVLRRCRFTITVTGRALLPRAAVDDLVRRCGQPGIGTVVVRTRAVSVTCSASWARRRGARWGVRVGETLELPDAAGALCEVDPDHPC